MKIEKGIPIPPQRPGRKLNIDWKKLEVGDSILIEDRDQAQAARLAVKRYEKTAWITAWQRADGSMWYPPAGITMGEQLAATAEEGQWIPIAQKQFTSRKVDGGWRIWRLKDKPISHEFEVTKNVNNDPLESTKLT